MANPESQEQTVNEHPISKRSVQKDAQQNLQPKDTSTFSQSKDFVLIDRVVVYDLGGQRIGWANYDRFKSHWSLFSGILMGIGYMGIAEDLNKLDFDIKKEVFKSKKEIKDIVAAPVKFK
ncbi:hypothetical protein L2E82_47621 [Cichorium intybus]|uniref:Uncharacterized protein n=1 Tax=Cichorium intybus TaxID=13427 RepID=A0ACB8YVU3_CICIN|nr:hypothetical protein L2E82_47621 [Cichorium intybus]